MKLSINGIKEQEAWKKAGIALPGYDVEAASEKARRIRYGFTLVSEIFSAYLSVELQMVFWKRECWTVGLPVWKLLIMM